MIDIEKIETLFLRANLPDLAGVALVPKGLEPLALESFAKHPDRHTGRYATTSIADFCRYVSDASQFQDPCPQVYIDDDAPAAHAIINPGNPADLQWHDWVADLCLDESDAYLALCELTTGSIIPDKLVDLIDDWPDCCSFSVNATPITTAAARAQFSDCTVETLRTLRANKEDFARTRSAMETMTMQAGLPNRLVFTCAPWRGLKARDIQVRISAAETSGAAALKLNLVGWGDLRRAMLEEFAHILGNADIGADLLTGAFTRPGGR